MAQGWHLVLGLIAVVAVLHFCFFTLYLPAVDGPDTAARPFSLIDLDDLRNKDTLVGTILPPIHVHPDAPAVFPNQGRPASDALKVAPQANVTVALVFIVCLTSALISGLGAVPFYFISEVSSVTLGLCNSVAGGLMLSASLSLGIEGVEYGVAMLAFGLVCGVIFIERVLEQYESIRLGELRGMNARKVLLVMGVMTLHALAEGVGMGMSFGGGEELGYFIAVAIAIHNIPEGLAVALVMVPRGVSVNFAVVWAIFSSLPQPLMAVPAFLFVDIFREVLPWGLGFAAGAMTWMVFTEILPDAVKETGSLRAVMVGAVGSMALMTCFQYFVLDEMLGAV